MAYVHWTEDTFDKLVDGDPEPLTSSFDVNHQMVMSLLDRPGDGCKAVRHLMVDNHEPRRGNAITSAGRSRSFARSPRRPAGVPRIA